LSPLIEEVRKVQSLGFAKSSDLAPLLEELRGVGAEIGKMRAAVGISLEAIAGSSTDVSQILAELSNVGSLTQAVRSVGEGVDRVHLAVGKSLDAIAASKTDTSPILEEMKKIGSLVDISASLKAMAETKSDMSPVMDALKRMEVAMDSKVVEGLRANKVDVDLSPLLAEMRQTREEVCAVGRKTDANFSPLTEEVRKVQSDAIAKIVQLMPLMEEVRSVGEEVAKTRTAVDISVQAIAASKTDVSPILEEMKKIGSLVEISASLKAIAETKNDLSPVMDALQKVGPPTDAKALEGMLAPLLEKMGSIGEEVGAVWTAVRKSLEANAANQINVSLILEEMRRRSGRS